MSEYEEKSVFSKTFDPVMQALLCFGLFAIISLVGSASGSLEAEKGMSNYFPWDIAGAFILFYAVANSVFSLSSKSMEKYWVRSIIAYIGLMVGLIGVCTLVTGKSIGEVASFKWIFIALTICYLIFLSLMRFLKSIVDFAQKEEWNNPRLRKRKKK